MLTAALPSVKRSYVNLTAIQNTGRQCLKIDAMFDWLDLPPETELRAPTPEELQAALIIARPDLAGTACEALGEGWAFRAYRAGDCVLRIPKHTKDLGTLPAEARVVAKLEPVLP